MALATMKYFIIDFKYFYLTK